MELFMNCILIWIIFLTTGETIFRRKTVRVKAQDGSPVSFMIRPKTLGNIDLRLTAKTSTAGDAIVRQLLVKVSNIFMTLLFHFFLNLKFTNCNVT